MKKTWVVGDIHGCYYTLINLLDELGYWDQLIFIGDYIDRGRHSNAVVDELIKLQIYNFSDKVICLKGNHEDMCLHYYGKYDVTDFKLAKEWERNGKQATLDSYPEGYVLGRHLDWMLSLPELYKDKNAYYVHAGLYPDGGVDGTCSEDRLWIRDEFLLSDHDFGKPVIHGHTPVERVQVSDTKVSIDTGCVQGNCLSAYCVETKEILSCPTDKRDIEEF
jgi:serine/threonine protein phosphatase 1